MKTQKPCRRSISKRAVLSSCVALLYSTTNILAAEYTLQPEATKQTILGLGVELQSDSIGSGNNGLPEQQTGIPHDLIKSERERFNNDLLQGFRYARVAMGLYYRGLTYDEKNLAERYPGQLEELRSTIMDSGMEGASAEYWSPPPFWKENGDYIGGTIDNEINYADFATAVVKDIKHFEDGGIPMIRWSIQNEPFTNNNRYSNAFYENDGVRYRDAYKATATAVREYNPNIWIHADSGHGQHSSRVQLFHDDPSMLELVDGWSHHRIGANSNLQINQADLFNSDAHGKPVYNNEYEYLDGKTSIPRMINTAQSIMNWMTFVDSPTWYWLHALKPSYNSESEGYGLGLWRPGDDDNFEKYAHIKQHHYDYLTTNFHAMAGFLRYMPWNSVRFEVEEDTVRLDQRIMAWITPQGQKVFALTNRGAEPFTFEIDISDTQGQFSGHRYDVDVRDEYLGTVNGNTVSITLPSMSIEYWVEESPASAKVSLTAMTPDICENVRNTAAECTGRPMGLFRVVRAGDVSSALTVPLVNRSSAKLGEDVRSFPMHVNFAPGQRTSMVRVIPMDDTEGEVTEEVALEVGLSPDYQLTANSRAVIRVHDDGDKVANWVGVYPVSELAEPNQSGAVEIRRSGDLSAELTVNLQYSGPAVQGIDYIAGPTNVTFTAGQEVVPVQLTVLDDPNVDPKDFVTVALLPSEDYYVGSPISTLKIADDEKPFEVVVDNTEVASADIIGDWATSSFSSDRIGENYFHDKKRDKGTKSVTYRPNLPSANDWQVAVFFADGNDRAVDVPVTINHANGSDTVLVDMTDGKDWFELGQYSFLNDGSTSVTISNDSSAGFVIADAIRFQDTGTTIDNTDPKVTVNGDWNTSSFSSDRIGNDYLHDRDKPKGALSVDYAWTAPKAGVYLAYVYYNSTSNRASNVPVTVTTASGSTQFTVNQLEDGGSWVLLDGFQLAEDEATTITISNAGTNEIVVADAVRWIASGSNE
ncbi:Calx-beta domain-containing protein [Paraglaciecola arctica]|uniref:golvesin C-terminal-like domain-containing protein n=1 Tax=Paraglaciecola arctica TaxID=1128911 RepID=UPI001C077B02|nr:Calx-beta domain-containing protein [Paraglaciecola arctica]MBU3005566.1 hypothetical protein [Paraglaciecola arctica]